MSALDKMNKFSASSLGGQPLKQDRSNLPYDDTTIKGYFFNSLLLNGFNLDEMKPVIEQSGNKLILAIAGSGKTTCLEFQVIYDIATGEATKVIQANGGAPTRVVDRVWVSTFLKSGAEELKERALYWQSKLGYRPTASGITFSTLHSEFKAVLTQIGVSTAIIDGKEARQILKDCMKSLAISKSDGTPLSNEDYRIIESIITYRRNRLDKLKYAHPSCSDYNLYPAVLDALVEKMRQSRRARNKLDFEDLQEILYGALQTNVHVQQLVADRYNYIYLDEFQDTSQIQYEILKYYQKGTKKVVAIGDDDQLIYSWRGSDVDIITHRFEEDFKPFVCSLSVNYRCPHNILAPVANSIVHNEFRHKKAIKSAKDGGVLKNYAFRSIKDMSLAFLDSLHEDLANKYDVAVICRTNFDGAIPAFLLEVKNIGSYSIKPGMSLDTALPRKIIDTVSIFLDKSSPSLKNTLEMVLPRQSKWKAQSFVDVCRNNSCNLFTVDFDDLEHSLPEIAELLGTLRQYKEDNQEIEGYKYFLNYLSYYGFRGDSVFCLNARAYIDMLLVLLESEYFEDLHDYKDRVTDIRVRMSSHVNKRNAHVEVTTVHEAKGKEWDSCYVWNDIEGVYPSSKTDKDNQLEFEEERRVHYIAWTRPKKKLTTLALLGLEGTFLKETKVVNEVPEIKSTALTKAKNLSTEIDDEAKALGHSLGARLTEA